LVVIFPTNFAEQCPVQIFEIYAPVCANNGKTYSNIYELQAANCDSDKAIKIASQGPCEPSAAEPSDDTTKIKKGNYIVTLHLIQHLIVF
jgi:hypothetical protein